MTGTRSFAVGFWVFLAFVVGASLGRLSVPTGAAQAKPIPPPSQYAHLRNPYALTDRAAVAEGERTYHRYCWICHGATGDGMGPGAPDIVPRPADFTDRRRVALMSDGYWFWRIKEGFPEDPRRLMPPWGKLLSDEEIWKVVTYEKTFAARRK